MAQADFYAFTMAQTLFENDEHLTPTCFHAFARNTPFQGAYILTAGQGEFLNWLIHDWGDHTNALIEFLAKQKGQTGKLLFTKDFLTMLEQAKPQLTIDALCEGTLAFAYTPIIRIFGPIWQCLLVEAYMLNSLNSQSIIATEASRIRYAADFKNKNAPALIIEGGMRRSQDISGLAPSRAAFIGGTDATTNIAASMEYDIPVRGTFSHAFVMYHWQESPDNGEAEAFRRYLKSYPDNNIILVDTYDSLASVKRACEISAQENIKLGGIRIDSGDLAYLSIQARRILDSFGLTDAIIVASNNLDPHVIYSLRQEQQAQIDVWLVGTRLVVASEQPSLGCVYKLGQVYNKTAESLYDAGKETLKISSDINKTTLPGALELIRFIDEKNGKILSDNLISASDKAKFISDDGKSLKSEMRCLQMKTAYKKRTFAKGKKLTLAADKFHNKRQANATNSKCYRGAHQQHGISRTIRCFS